jgi:hypothetical protein
MTQAAKTLTIAEASAANVAKQIVALRARFAVARGHFNRAVELLVAAGFEFQRACHYAVECLRAARVARPGSRFNDECLEVPAAETATAWPAYGLLVAASYGGI